jgi:hypothetical protein
VPSPRSIRCLQFGKFSGSRRAARKSLYFAAPVSGVGGLELRMDFPAVLSLWHKIGLLVIWHASK